MGETNTAIGTARETARKRRNDRLNDREHDRLLDHERNRSVSLHAETVREDGETEDEQGKRREERDGDFASYTIAEERF